MAPIRPADVPTEVDALVVGGGPAGLSAALWLGRYRRRTLVVDAGEPRNRDVDEVHGVLGRDATSPTDLRDAARSDVDRYPHVSRVHGRVTDLGACDGGFVAEIDGTRTVASRRVVLTTGVRDDLPDIDGCAEHYGADLFHCPTCDGYEASGRAVVVVGWGPHVPAFAAELLDWAASVSIVSDGPRPLIDRRQRRRLAAVGIDLLDDEATGLVGRRGALRAVQLASGRQLPAELVFFSIGHEPRVDLAVKLGCDRTAEGVLQVDERQATTVPGVYAAGDVTPGMQLVAVAVGEGTIAGVACAESLHGHRTAPDAPPSAPPASALAP